MCGFAAHLADVGLKHRSVKPIYRVRFFQVKVRCNDPLQGVQVPRLEYVTRGIKNNEVKTGSGSRERLPITPVILRCLQGVWSKSGGERDTKLIWAACCLCFFCFSASGRAHRPDWQLLRPKRSLECWRYCG